MNKKVKKLVSFMALALALVPMVNVNAAETAGIKVGTEQELRDALLQQDESVVLTSNIEVNAPLYVDVNKVINGEGFTISASDAFANDGANGSLLTVTQNGNVTLNNVTLDGAVKYGLQVYNGGSAVIKKATITNSGFGAILINGGTLSVTDLTMNGNTFGIEFGKGTNVTSEPSLVMDGKISGNQVDLLVLATNDNLGKVVVENTPNSEMKLAVDGKKLVLKDKDGKVVATSNEAKDEVVVEGEEVVVPTPTPTPTPDNTPSENPNTNDGIMTYITLAILGFGALAISSKKVLQ